MTWVLPALLAPLIWAIVVLIDDNLVRHVYKGAHVGAVISGAFGLVPAIFILFYKDVNLGIPASLIVLSLFAGFINVLYYFFYFQALEKEHPSVVIALFSLTPAAIPFIAYFVVQERLTATEIIGFSVVVISTLIYALTDIRKFKFSKALVPVLIAALILDTVSIINKYVYNKVDFAEAYFYFCIGMFLGGLYFFYVLKFLKSNNQLKKILNKNSLWLLTLLAFVELLNIGAEFLRNFAISQGPVSLVKALENIQPLYILVISFVLFPFLPQYFPEAASKNLRLKFLLCGLMVLGIFIAV